MRDPHRQLRRAIIVALSIAACGYVIFGLHALTFGFFAAWLTGAAILSFGYSIRHSCPRGTEQPEADPRRA
ncbi:hypothetical protein [Streptacidiphilus neutrinimicus]|uniref:hypothetical protein n=1 Tax=Streptacidiphilus neutrinimicus TaxID=105420 RepID=UPI0005AB7912|nr:hypothetical protein [Streptacidiphilus neutrinimicus]